MWHTHNFQSVADTHLRVNNVIHCLADQQVIEMKATNSPVSYSCLTINRELKK